MSLSAKRPLRHGLGVYIAAAGVFSLAINLLYLAGPLYMLQVYDRVLASGSVPTLVMLTIVLLIAYAALAGLDWVRSRLLARAAVRLDALLGERVVLATLDHRGDGERSRPLRDFDTVRHFITGPAMHALFDLPWAPVYVGVIALLHPALGAFAAGCVVLLLALAFVNEWLVRGVSAEASDFAARNYRFTEASLRNAEVIRAMGMGSGLIRAWSVSRDGLLWRQLAASDRGAAMASLIKFARLAMQSLVLGLGALLAIERMTTVGTIFAGSILLGRALQPVEQLVSGWRSVLAARSAWGRVRVLLESTPEEHPRLALPRPAGALSVENLTLMADAERALLRGVGFSAAPGTVLGIVGPSGAGKSTLARLLVGVLAPTAGTVRLDGADIAAWPRAEFGRHIGYLPQDVELFAGTVAANIGRFDTGNDDAVIRAARLAGVHETILRLPRGYDTRIGEAGAVLSGGVPQRVALARAVYGDPAFVVLDEPSASLDADGDAALKSCVEALKSAGATVVVVSHRPATLAVCDEIVVLNDGTVQFAGPRESVMRVLFGQAEPRPAPPVRDIAALNLIYSDAARAGA